MQTEIVRDTGGRGGRGRAVHRSVPTASVPGRQRKAVMELGWPDV